MCDNKITILNYFIDFVLKAITIIILISVLIHLIDVSAHELNPNTTASLKNKYF